MGGICVCWWVCCACVGGAGWRHRPYVQHVLLCAVCVSLSHTHSQTPASGVFETPTQHPQSVQLCSLPTATTFMFPTHSLLQWSVVLSLQ